MINGWFCKARLVSSPKMYAKANFNKGGVAIALETAGSSFVFQMGTNNLTQNLHITQVASHKPRGQNVARVV